jgi:transcriptional regulator
MILDGRFLLTYIDNMQQIKQNLHSSVKMSSTSGDRVTNFLQELHQSSDNNEIDLQIMRIKLRISKLQDNKIKPLKRRIKQLIEKI